MVLTVLLTGLSYRDGSSQYLEHEPDDSIKQIGLRFI